MNISRLSFLTALFAVAAASHAEQLADRAALNAIIGAGTLDDFEAYSVANGSAEAMNTGVLDSTTIVNGQGPGLVQPGATYSSSPLFWNGNGYYSLSTKAIGGGSNTLSIDYASPMLAFGLDAKGFEGYGYEGQALVYSGSTLLDTLNFGVAGGATSTFVGYRSALGITRVEMVDLYHSFSPVIDNHQYGIEAVPEPATMAALGLGALGILRRRRKA